MAHGDFVWCDLSSFELDKAKSFYGNLFSWRFAPLPQPDGSNYLSASIAAGEQAGLFEMPARFQEMGLPSFWMSYIEVDDVDEAIQRAQEHGGKIELGPIVFDEEARIALIRDPLGAGFTVIESSRLPPRGTNGTTGAMRWNALYVSDAKAVLPFYEALFGWKIEADGKDGRYRVLSGGKHVSDVFELPEDIRGRFEFWGVHFAVDSLSEAKARLIGLGGEVIYEDGAQQELLARDLNGAAFFLTAGETQKAGSGSSVEGASRWPVKTALALIVLWGAVLFDATWLWGLLFLVWTVPALRSGTTYLVEPVTRRNHPVFFWGIVGTWIFLSLYLILFDLLPTGFVGS